MTVKNAVLTVCLGMLFAGCATAPEKTPLADKTFCEHCRETVTASQNF
ncbi:MAG: hypothetical protein KTQ49_03755 [Candidatus Omnitrophica bacterium]|nr:hypothetical protein [Candidatus Omnitrophota bacterium]